MGHKVHWDRHVPLYRNADGTLWIRFLTDDSWELEALSLHYVDHEFLFSQRPGLDPLFVHYDPKDGTVVGVALTGDSDRLFQAPRVGARHLPGSSAFLIWGFLPDVLVLFAASSTPISVARIQQASWAEKGTPLVDIETYKLLGVSSPLMASEDVFLEWIDGDLSM